MDKMTYVSALDVALTALKDTADVEVLDKLTALKDQLVKRATAEHKPTQKQVDNAVLCDAIKLAMQGRDPMTLSEIAELLEDDYSSQKLNALVTRMVKVGDVVRTEIKRKAYFALAR